MGEIGKPEGGEGLCPPHDWPNYDEAPATPARQRGFGPGADPQAGRGFGQRRVIKTWICKKCGETVESDIRPAPGWTPEDDSDEEDND